MIRATRGREVNGQGRWPQWAMAALLLAAPIGEALADITIPTPNITLPPISIGAGMRTSFTHTDATSGSNTDNQFALDSVRSVSESLVGLVAGSGIVLWIALVAEALLKKEAMGFGDVKFVGAIGAFCGWHGALFSIFGGAAFGTVWIGAAVAWQKAAGTRSSGAPRAETPEGVPADIGLGVHVPFGPMLAIAGAVYFLFLRGWVDAWFAELTALLK